MKLFKHVTEQPFVFATGLAALVHSTWSLGTLFSGRQPQAGFTIEFAGWIVPAFLIAFAMDVGQISTSAEIRAGHRTRAKYATFAVFAVSTYFLQWLYMAHHMPLLDLAAGVRDEWRWLATLIRDAAVWIIPLFLPLSTLMYTFSSETSQHVVVPQSIIEPQNLPVQVSTPMHQALPEPEQEEEVEVPTDLNLFPLPDFIRHLKSNVTTTETSEEKDAVHLAKCEACGWEKSYDNAKSARAALSTHMARYCKAIHIENSPVLTSTNGHREH